MLLDLLNDILKGYLVLVILWLITLVVVLVTLFRRKDIIGPVKYFWAAIIFFAPVVGLVFYLLFGLKGRKRVLPETEHNSPV
jgi:hypothetical protein